MRSRLLLGSAALVVAALGCARSQAGARAIAVAPPEPPIVCVESFDRLDPAVWREVELKGKTAYAVVEVDGNRVLKADSRAQASILIRQCRFDPSEYPWLSWRWRVDQFIEGEDLERKEGSDAPARVYVYFDGRGLPWQKRSVDYVWSVALPLETVLTSPFLSLSKMIVAESGRGAQGTWRFETRNLVEDFRRCFQKEPPDVVAIAVMTDTDTTGRDAVAYFDDLQVRRDPPAEGASK